MIKRAVLYARVSGDDRGREGRNLTGQLDMCREYALERNWQVVEELAEDDRGAPGASFELPELNRAREMAKAGEYDVLVVSELDRLSRKLAKQLVVEEELNRMGVEVDYVLADYEDTPEGRLNKHIRATIAEYEREKINERMVRGRWLKVKSGHVLVHSTPPYGYSISEAENGKTTLEIYDPEARIVRMIYNWYAKGDDGGSPLSMKAIARKLSEMRVPTRQDMMKGRGGYKKMGWGQWSPSTISKILGSEVYKGKWHYGKENHSRQNWIGVDVPAIIDSELWAEVEKLRKRNKHNSVRRAKHNYLMTGQIRCGHCGSPVNGHPNIWRSKNASGLNLYYRCSGAEGQKVNISCNLPQFRVDQVDTLIWEWVKSFLVDPIALEEGLAAYHEEREEDNIGILDRIAVIDDLLSDNREHLERLIDLYLAGEFSKELLVDRKHRLETTIESLRAEKRNLQAYFETRTMTPRQLESIKEFANEVSLGIDAADVKFEKRRQIIELLNVQAILTVEDDSMKVLNVNSVLGVDKCHVNTLFRARILGVLADWRGCHRW